MSSSQPQASPQGCSTAHPPPVACGARKQERSVRTRRALIHSAAERFERHGYERTKLSEVSEGAGVTTGALHFHFRNKADLAEAVEYAAIRNLYRAARRSRRDRTDALTELTSLSYALAQLLHRDVVSRAGFRLNYETSGRTRLSIHQEWQGCVQRLLVQAGEEAGSPLGPCLSVSSPTPWSGPPPDSPCWPATTGHGCPPKCSPASGEPYCRAAPWSRTPLETLELGADPGVSYGCGDSVETCSVGVPGAWVRRTFLQSEVAVPARGTMSASGRVPRRAGSQVRAAVR